MAGQLIDFKTMNNLDYHKKQLKYNMTAMLLAINEAFPNEVNPDFDDSRIIEIVKDMPSLPMMAGGIAKELGIDKNIVTLELWEDFCNGYAPANKLPKNSPLRDQVIDTPRGPMVRFSKNASLINDRGEYVLDPIKPKKGKGKRLGTEFIFGMPSNVSSAIGRLASDDPSYEAKFTAIMNDVIKNHVLPAMLEDALIRTGTDGTQLSYAKEVLMVSYNHTENRQELPFYHAHVDLLNAALGYDDKLYTLCTDQIIQNKDHYNAIFQSEMKDRLEKEFGFVFKPVYLAEDLENEYLADHERNICSYDLIDDFVPANVQEFAHARQKEIEDAVRAKGKAASFLEMEHARLETREEKTDLSPSELKANWKTTYDELGYTADHVKKAMVYNQVMLNTARNTDDQMIKNYQRKVNDQAVRKGQSTKFGNQVPKTPQKYANSTTKAMPFPSYEDESAADQRMISSFIRKHREVSFTETQFKSHMVKQLLETHDKDSAWRKAEQIFADNCLHMMDKTKVDYFREFMENKAMEPMDRQQKMIQWAKNMQFTTKGIRNMEMEIFDTLNARKGETYLAYSKKEVSEFILKWEAKKSEQFGKKIKFQTGQRNAAIASICTKGGVINVAGAAGSGKSFMVECVKDFYEEKGVQMFGTSTSSAASNELAKSVNLDAGKYHNVAKLLHLLKTETIKLTKDTILTVDEAGMMDLDTMHALVKHVNKAGARLLLVGEKEQLQNVGLGSIFRNLNDAFGFTKISEINRQQDHWQREMVHDFAAGQSAKAIKSLYDNGRVTITATEDERVRAAVKAYLEATNKEERTVKFIGESGKSIKKVETVEVATGFDQKVMIAATNYDVERLNNAIRAELKLKGELPEKDEATITCADKVERGFSISDRVIFTKSTKSVDADPMDIANSQAGTITGFKIDRLTKKPFAIKIMLDTGKEIYLDCKKKKPAIRSAYCITTHKSQGQTRMSGFYFVSQNMNSLHQAYVACSRHKQNLTMFLSEEMGDKLAEKLEDKPPTERMLKVAGWIAKQRGVELTPDITDSFTQTRAFLNENYERFDKTGEPKHPTDFWTDIITAMSKTQYKKSTLDYQLLDGEQIKTYEEIQKARKEMLKTPEKLTEELIDKVKKDDYVPEYARTGKAVSVMDLPTIAPKVRTPDKIPLIEPVKKIKKKKEIALTR